MPTVKDNFNRFELDKLRRILDDLCRQCDFYETDQCNQSQCLAGFTRKVTLFADQKNVLDIPGGHKLMPQSDFKPYYRDLVAVGLAETCRQCRECRDNHNNDCVISLARHALENMVLKENVPYPGSVFMYLAAVKKQDAALSDAIAANLKK